MSETARDPSLEERLIDQFKKDFYEKMGYSPIVLSNAPTKDKDIPLMSLSDLEEYLKPFCPMINGRKASLKCVSRQRDLVEVRLIYAYLARMMRYTFQKIGGHMNRHHSSIIHYMEAFMNLMETCEPFQAKYTEILNYIKSQHKKESDESPIMVYINQVSDISQSDLLS